MDVPTPDTSNTGIRDGVALALSGGGYRAMVFHVGALCRLNEARLLQKLACVSSVSGGSITAGALALAWPELDFKDGVARNLSAFVAKVQAMADTSVDIGAVIGGIFLPGTISDRVAARYDDVIFKGATLQDLPEPKADVAPRFVFNATNVQSSVRWRFSRDVMGDWRVGLVDRPTVPLCQAVAASSAFPPVLSPMTLPISQPMRRPRGADLARRPFTKTAILTDGGVYDNLGLEELKGFKTLLVSDAGQKIEPDGDPAHDWARHSIRILDTVDNQVRSLRKRHLMERYLRGDHDGCYWGIRTQAAKYRLTADPLGVARRDPTALASEPTRLEALPRAKQNKLMNWGYAVCDAALRAHVDPQLQAKLGIALAPPRGFPFPDEY